MSTGAARKQAMWINSIRSMRVIGAVMLTIASVRPIFAADARPLPSAHAHNDYLHPRPLLDALEQGFCSVEADVFVVDGDLWVAHERDELRPERTLKSLYLEPLRQRIALHGGRVYRDGPPFTLLIDFKSEAEPTYAALLTLLGEYEPMLIGLRDRQPVDGAVQVVISGNRPMRHVAQQYQSGDCLVAIDGRLTDLRDSSPRPWMPLISDRWTAYFTWNGQGELPEAERRRLEQIVAQTHGQGKRLRFWATPDQTAMWQALHRAGVDLINTDDLTGLAAFLQD
jgi:hypothetical protein